MVYSGIADKEALNELCLFAGAGGGLLGTHLLGWRAVCYVFTVDTAGNLWYNLGAMREYHRRF